MPRPAPSPTGGLTYVAPGDPLADLSADRRRRDRDALAAGEPVDVLVVGGGITGAGVALDAATRGLSVALVERHDLAHGTSRWSSKLVHGGLRYLAHGDVGVAWESAVERAHLVSTIAPHLVHPLTQVVPVMDDTAAADALLTRIGFVAGDALKVGARTRRGALPRARRIDADTARALCPTLDARRLRGAAVNVDGQLEDDARLVVAVARTAAAYGARILTRTSALEIGPGGTVVSDGLDGGTYEIRARHVVNATGVWAGELDPRVTLSPSRGTHVVLRGQTLGRPTASLTVQVPGERGRYVFSLPQPDGLVYVGLTDVPAPGPVPDVPEPTADEIAWVLDVLSTVLGTPLTPADAVGAFAGLRPLVVPAAGSDTPEGETADISRRHLVRRGHDGLVTVTGGKLTTYRRMAEDVVDLLTEVPCRTTQVPLVGAGVVPPPVADPRIPVRILRRYGVEAPLVASYADGHPELLRPLAPDVPVLGVELVHGVLREGALDLDDLLSRRTRVALVPDDLAAATPRAAELLDGLGLLPVGAAGSGTARGGTARGGRRGPAGEG